MLLRCFEIICLIGDYIWEKNELAFDFKNVMTYKMILIKVIENLGTFSFYFKNRPTY